MIASWEFLFGGTGSSSGKLFKNSNSCCGDQVWFNANEWNRNCRGGSVGKGSNEENMGGFYGYNIADNTASCYQKNVWMISLGSVAFYFLIVGIVLMASGECIFSSYTVGVDGVRNGTHVQDAYGNVFKANSSA